MGRTLFAGPVELKVWEIRRESYKLRPVRRVRVISNAKEGLARNAVLPIKARANAPFRSMFLMNRPFHPLLRRESAFRAQQAMHVFHLRQLGGGSGENAPCS